MFGELALLDGAPRTAQARAAEDCVLAALSRADFENLLETHARIASKIALQLARDLGHKLTARLRHDRVAAAVRLPYLASGPVVWLTTIAITTVLLVAAAKALWLVVPFLLAIILYYMLYPVVRRLVLSGIGRNTAALLVAAGVTILAVP